MTDPWTSPSGAGAPRQPADLPPAARPAPGSAAAADPYAAPAPPGVPTTYGAPPRYGAGHPPLTREQQRAAARQLSRAATDARLPREPAEYQHVLRGPARRWWKPLLSIPLVVVITIAVTLVASLVGALAVLASGTQFDLTPLDTLDMNNPWVFAISMLSLAILIPISMLAIRLVHGVRTGYLHSVAGRFRWGWAARLTAVLLPVFALYVGSYVLLEGVTWDPRPGWPLMMVLVILLVPFQAAGEEYAMRGVFMQAIGSWIPHRVLSLVIPGVLSAGVFAVLHGSSDPWILLNLAAFAALAVYATWRTGGLEAAVVIHALNNVLLFLTDVGGGDMNANIVGGTSEGSVADLLVALVFFTVVGVVVTMLARRYDPQRRTVPPELPVRPGYPAAPPVAYSPGTTTAAPTEVRTAGVDGGTQGR